MPILSRKPVKKPPYDGTPPKPPLSAYALEAEITATGQARAQVGQFNRQMLRITQPYSRAAELRAGQAFPQQQRAAIAAERVGIDGPYSRGMNSVSLGKRRPLRDVGP